MKRLLGESFSRSSLYFENSIEKKVQTINNLKCNVFVDDLQHVLDRLEQTGSTATKILLINPSDSEVRGEGGGASFRKNGLINAHSWFDVTRIVEKLS